MNRIHAKLRELNLIPCAACGDRRTTRANEQYLEHILCEYEEVCLGCGRVTNYWAYGGYQFPRNRTERVARFFNSIKQRYQSWRITRAIAQPRKEN